LKGLACQADTLPVFVGGMTALGYLGKSQAWVFCLQCSVQVAKGSQELPTVAGGGSEHLWVLAEGGTAEGFSGLWAPVTWAWLVQHSSFPPCQPRALDQYEAPPSRLLWVVGGHSHVGARGG
jgi:hypothetical protein